MRTVKPYALECVLYENLCEWIIEWKGSLDDDNATTPSPGGEQDAGAAHDLDGEREACAA